MPTSGGCITVSPDAPQDLLACLCVKLSSHMSTSCHIRGHPASFQTASTSSAGDLKKQVLAASRPVTCRIKSGTGLDATGRVNEHRHNRRSKSAGCSVGVCGRNSCNRMRRDQRPQSGSAAVFRRPVHSTAAPHQRPIFLSGENGVNPRICVDTSQPNHFTCHERALVDRGWRRLPLTHSVLSPAVYTQSQEPHLKTLHVASVLGIATGGETLSRPCSGRSCRARAASVGGVSHVSGDGQLPRPMSVASVSSSKSEYQSASQR